MRTVVLLRVVLALGVLTACGKKKSSSETADAPEAPAPGPSPEEPAPDGGKDPGETPEASVDPGTLTLVPDEGLVAKPRRPFDLRNKELRFVPEGGGYRLTSVALAAAADKGTELTTGKTSSGFNFAFEKTLPFSFAFAGQTWTKVYVNLKGNLTFGDPEYNLWTKRDPWADGGLRSVAAAINLLSLEGKDKLIAGLWELHRDAKIYVKESATEILFTWVAQKDGWYKAKSTEGYKDDSVTNTFQIRLKDSGEIDLLYPDVKSDLGIVGIFDGGTVGTSTLVDEATDSIYNGTDAKSHIKGLRVYNENTTVRFEYEMTQAVEATESVGQRSYRIWLDNGFNHCKEFGATIASTMTGSSCGTAPRVVTTGVSGSKVDIRVSKEKFADEPSFKVYGDVVWWGGPAGAFSQIHLNDPRVIPASAFAPLTLDLSAGGEAAGGTLYTGNVYEVFHEAVVSRDGFDMLAPIAKTHAMDEDFALSFTDFPIDDLYGVTPSTGAVNVKIKGIGDRQASPQDTSGYGFPKLQATTDVTALTNAINLPEGIDIYNYAWKNHGPVVRLFEHELMHRWGMALSMIHPETKAKIALNDGDGHWIHGLDTTSLAKVSSQFSDTEYTETSSMGGASWADNGDGTFTPTYRPPNAPSGMAAIDLYVLGLIPPSEMPDLTLIENLVDLGNGKFSGKKLTFKIADVIAASGERDPPAASAQKGFKLSGYLIHKGDEPAEGMHERAQAVLTQIRKMFELASGGRMKMP